MAITINRGRTISAGKITRVVTGDPITIDPDADLVGDAARALATAIAAGIKGIAQQVSPATERYRERARRALAKGKAWAVKRYAGGRTPGGSSAMFNDSGELAAGIACAPTSDGYAITAPSNRLGDLPGAPMGSTMERLRALVPALRDPFSVPAVRAALEASWPRLVRKGG